MSYIPPPLRSKNNKPSTIDPQTKETYSPPKKPTKYHPPSHSTYNPSSHSTYHPSSHSTYHPSSHSTYHPPSDSTYNPRYNTRGRGMRMRGRGRGRMRMRGRGRGILSAPMTSTEEGEGGIPNGRQYIIENYRSNYPLTHGPLPMNDHPFRGRGKTIRGRTGFYNNSVSSGRSMLNNNWRDKQAINSPSPPMHVQKNEEIEQILANIDFDQNIIENIGERREEHSFTVDMMNDQQINEYKTISYHPYSQPKYEPIHEKRWESYANEVKPESSPPVNKSVRYAYNQQKDSMLVTGINSGDRYNRTYNPSSLNIMHVQKKVTYDMQNKLSNDFKSLNIENGQNRRRRRRRKVDENDIQQKVMKNKEIHENISKCYVNGIKNISNEKRNKNKNSDILAMKTNQNHVQLRVIHTKQPPPVNWAAAAMHKKNLKSLDTEIYSSSPPAMNINGYQQNMRMMQNKASHVFEVILQNESGSGGRLNIENVQKLTKMFRRLSIEYKTVVQIQERSFVCFKNVREAYSAYSRMRLNVDGFLLRRIDDRPADVQLLVKHGIPPASPIMCAEQNVSGSYACVSSVGGSVGDHLHEDDRNRKRVTFYSAKREWKPK